MAPIHETTYPAQLGRALADPMLDLWIDPDRLAAFVREELRGLHPEAQKAVEHEERYALAQHRMGVAR